LVIAFNLTIITPSFASTTLTGANLAPINPVNAANRGKGGITEEKKQELVKETVDGTVMRSGVVYPLHAPVAAIDLARAFLREGRPAHSANEIRELVNGLATGDPRALENYRKHMSAYLMDPSKGPQLIGALNRAIDNPNAYKSDPTFAQGVLRESFEKFLTLNGNNRPKTDFSKVNLDGFTITGTDLRQTGLKGSNLNIFDDWTSTNASGLDLKDVDWQGKTVRNSIFMDAILEDANFANMNIGGSNFDRANLYRANFSGTTNSGNASFAGSKLQRANFGGVTAPNANFNGADLSNADFKGADMQGADFRNANISNLIRDLMTNFLNAQYGDNLTGCPTR
jgi:uncharacterized protein YjbI with pentapeptide repeats